MLTANRRTSRLIRLVGAMKRGEYPNAQALARSLSRGSDRRLAACGRTLQRDIAYLQLRLDAPVAYNAARRGYCLTDPEWVFPLEELRGDLLYASLLGEQLSLAIVPAPFRSSLEAALKAQLAAADPDDVDRDLLKAVVFATGATAALDPAVFEVIHAAWRDRRRLRLVYATEKESRPSSRDVDVHALFLAHGAWYARVYCHMRKDWRSLALHRIGKPQLLKERFDRDLAVLAQVRAGNVFDYKTVCNVIVQCAPSKARLISEREWFPGQQMRRLDDGSLRLSFPEVPRPELVWWVLSYAGTIEVLRPADVREEIHRSAQLLARRHAPRARTPRR